jgi:hypothetical protein
MKTKKSIPMPACATIMADRVTKPDHYGSYDMNDEMSDNKNDWRGWYSDKAGNVIMHSRRTFHQSIWNHYADHLPGVSNYLIQIDGWQIRMDEPLFRLPGSSAKIAAMLVEVVARVRPVGNRRTAFENNLRAELRKVYPFPSSPTIHRFYDDTPQQRAVVGRAFGKAA